MPTENRDFFELLDKIFYMPAPDTDEQKEEDSKEDPQKDLSAGLDEVYNLQQELRARFDSVLADKLLLLLLEKML